MPPHCPPPARCQCIPPFSEPSEHARLFSATQVVSSRRQARRGLGRRVPAAAVWFFRRPAKRILVHCGMIVKQIPARGVIAERCSVGATFLSRPPTSGQSAQECASYGLDRPTQQQTVTPPARQWTHRSAQAAAQGVSAIAENTAIGAAGASWEPDGFLDSAALAGDSLPSAN